MCTLARGWLRERLAPLLGDNFGSLVHARPARRALPLADTSLLNKPSPAPALTPYEYEDYEGADDYEQHYRGWT